MYPAFTLRLAIFPALMLVPLVAGADATIDPVNPYSYAANVGWLNNKHDQPAAPAGLVVSEFTISGYAYGANIGWITFGSGTPADGVRYSNVNLDTGVNHDGSGNLSGYAYSANTGWISLSWGTVGTPNTPRVNLANGQFSGYAYGANIGWLDLGTLRTASIAAPDADADGIADAWETSYFGNLTTASATTDSDGDGISDLSEYHSMTSPTNSSDYLKIISQALNSGLTQVTLTFTANGKRRYRMQWSPDLAMWVNDTANGIFYSAPGATTTRTMTFPSGTKRFFRAVAIKPLQN